ncbi:hypothetical protein Hanom_Chr05g00473751 [Helianthus anomalus]
MPSSYPGRHMSLPRLEPGTSGKRWVSVANWATPGFSLSSVWLYNIELMGRLEVFFFKQVHVLRIVTIWCFQLR